MKTTPYENAIIYLEGLGNMRSGFMDPSKHQTPKVYIDRMRALVKELAIDLSAIKLIHITGTSGKGSVSNLIYQNLLKHKQKAGIFTSPFVTSTTEKIAVGGLFISADAFVRLTERMKPAIDRVYLNYPYGCPSYFEAIAAIAFMHFEEEKCSHAIIEAGCGGRYDGTNVIKNPAATAITNVDLDHIEILGDTVEKIAYDKAGIIKKGSPFFTAEERPKLLKMFKDICQETGAAYHPIEVKGKTVSEKNRQLAQAITESLRFTFTLKPEEVKRLPARFETLSQNPLVIVDGAHNPAKIQSTLENMKAIPHKKLILVLAMAGNKNTKSGLKDIIKEADVIFLTRFRSPFRRCAEPKDLLKIAKKHARKTTKIEVILDPISAFDKARNLAKPEDAILVTGSFFLAGDIRSLHYPEKYILKKRKSS